MQITAAFAGALPHQKFAAAVEALIPDWITNSAAPPLLLAVSGGPDSLALLALAHTNFSGRVAAMTVDHGLRKEAAAEARFVAELCAEIGVPHCIATAPPFVSNGNIQAAARTVRYQLLEEEAARLGGAYILTAHHHDDQLETLLMRLSRGSGVAGLSSIRPMNGRIVRPLLGFAKAELQGVCDSMGWAAIHDPSNDNADYDRVAMRRILQDCPLPITADALARSTKALREADEALDWMMERLRADHLTLGENGAILEPARLPHEVVRRLMLCALSHMGQAAPRGDQIERAIASLHAGTAISLGDIVIRAKGRDAPKWHFTPAPPRRSPRTVRE